MNDPKKSRITIGNSIYFFTEIYITKITDLNAREELVILLPTCKFESINDCWLLAADFKEFKCE